MAVTSLSIERSGRMATWLNSPPIGLILIACLEYNHAPYFLTVPLAILFLAGRILHPMGMKDGNISWSPRVKGMKLTLISLIGLSICNIVWISMIIFGYSMT